jgi:histidine triad (HIT) family protein
MEGYKMSYKIKMQPVKKCLTPVIAILLLITITACAQFQNKKADASAARTGWPVLSGDYDPDNQLALTARGELQSAKLYEDDHVLAFLGDRPYAPGHFVVISKTSKARNFIEMDSEDLCSIMSVTQKVAAAEIIAIGAEGFTLRQNNGSSSSIHQFHLHVIPRRKGDVLKDTPGSAVSLSELEPMAEKIMAALKGL